MSKRSKSKSILNTESNTPDKLKAGFALFPIIISFALLLYANTLMNGFVYDDISTIVTNTLIKDLDNLPSLLDKKAYFAQSAETTYRPVVTLTYFIDYALYGSNPWGYHLTNIILHAANGILLYIFLMLLLKETGLKPLLASLLFVSHPVLTESVNSISFREDLLVFIFYMGALILYLHIRPQEVNSDKKANSGNDKRSLLLYFVSCVLYFFALLSKEMAVTFPLIVCLYEWVYSNNKNKGFKDIINRYVLGYFSVTVVYVCIRFFLFLNLFEEKPEAWGVTERIITVPWLIASYIKRILFAVFIPLDYVFFPLRTIFSLRFVVPIIVLMSILAISLFEKKRKRELTFGVLFFLLTLIPVYNLVPLINPFAMRYLYLPIAGLIIASSFLLPAKVKRPGFRKKAEYLSLFIIIIIIFNSISVISRNRIWRDQYTLWSDAVKKMPNSPWAHNGLGHVYSTQGRMDDAIREFKVALRLRPDYADVHNSLGMAYGMQGHPDIAMQEFSYAVALKPNYIDAIYNLGLSYDEIGRVDDAIRQYMIVLKLNPYHVAAYNNLGYIYLSKGMIDEAIAEFNKALRISPGFATARNNMNKAYRMKRVKDEVSHEE